MSNRWKFIDDKASFELESPQLASYLYFPLANEGGMMSSITPSLGGDIKTGQNTFFTLPVSADDLHNLKSGRNFWVHIEGHGAWSAAGASSAQRADCFNDASDERLTVQAGFLWHKVMRENSRLGIRSEITSFVPAGADQVELMRVQITNTGTEALAMTPTSALPVYGRSADNVRDHRHVTGLLNRIYTVAAGIEVQLVMTFDERGHKRNSVCYAVYGVDEAGSLPVGTFPAMEEFIGEGGSLEWPEAVARNLKNFSPSGTKVEGYEAVGALRFKDEVLQPGCSKTYILLMAVTADRAGEHGKFQGYLSPEGFRKHLDASIAFWEEKLGKMQFASADETHDQWMKWITLQPVLRRIYGCSFMPHHDYGRGGRGWRDLWQDCLALLLLEPETARTQLLNNFGGVRMDGTNATIIGKASGEFIADRNSISRVWSDHGVWPMFTTLLYVNNSGDMDFLFEQQTYFKDRLAMRGREADADWTPEYGNKQKCADGKVYTGTILEHLLLQNLTAFYNVGRHNNVRLENADWNDALDLAYDKGETVAFSAFYAGNLMELSRLLRELKGLKEIEEIELGIEMTALFDTLNAPVNYESAEAKRAALLQYYNTCRHDISGKKVSCPVDGLAQDLEKKALWLMNHIRTNEWIKSGTGHQWFNGYYDNAGERVEGDRPTGVRMTLTGQVFPVMMGIATDEQVEMVAAACRHNLFDEALGGYRLNTNFHEVKLDMGRCFGFAYGHKENGAVFSHMAVMYAYALYHRGFVGDGYEVIQSLYNLSTDFDKARIYPGIPEYFNSKGRGMYHYLTGSASWLLLVMLAEVYGVRGRLGDLVLEPKLKKEQFDSGCAASVQTMYAGRKLKVTYRNADMLDYGNYKIGSISLDGAPVVYRQDAGAAILARELFAGRDAGAVHTVDVTLVDKSQEKKGN